MRSKTARRMVWLCTLALCAGGAYVAYTLSEHHITGGFGDKSFLGRMCEQGTASCDDVIKSKWGVFLGIPTAVWGTMYFSGVGLWYLLAGLPNRAGRAWQSMLIAGTGVGVVIAAVLAFIMFFALPSWCPLCSMTHAASLLIFLASLLMWPAAPKAAQPATDRAAFEPVPAAAPALSALPGLARVASACVGVVLGVVAVHQNFFARWHAAEKQQALGRLETWASAFESEGGNPKALETLTLRPDDAVKGDAKAPNILVVFSDFECPLCGGFVVYWKKDVEPYTRGKVRMVYRYFPMNTECNAAISTTLHERSCEAATIAEAARLQGGTDVFWKMHDELFVNQLRRNKRLTPAELAAKFGLDGARLERDMKSARVRDRIQEDIELAKKVGVKGTPYVFLNGRHVATDGTDPRWRRFLDSVIPATTTAPAAQAK